jgi:multiple sugar transport system substrate-binding protein
MKLTRLIAGTVLAGLAMVGQGVAQDPTTLTIISHRVHENVARGLGAGTAGGDIMGEWAKAHNVTLNWITADIDPMHDRLLRELTLPQGSIDVAFVINKYATPRLTRMLEPLGPYMEKSPIEAADGIPQKLLDGLTLDGNLFGIPFRHATTGMHYNMANIKAAGLDGPPKSIEEVVEYARKLTRKDADGNQIYGMTVPAGSGPFAILSLFSGFGANLFDSDLNVTANSPEMVEALTTMRDLFKEGVLPPNLPTLSIDEIITLVQQGRTGLAIDPFARYGTFNSPDAAKYPGQVLVAAIPGRAGAEPTVVAMTEIWAMVIPANAPHKDLAWDFIRTLSSPDATVRAALNGNGPIRPAAYDDPRVQKMLPYWQAEAQAIANATMLPSHYDGAAETGQIFMEEFQSAVLGFKSPEDAAAAMQQRIEAQFN